MKINQKIRRQLEEALYAAKLKHCAVAEPHQRAMKLYLETWVVARLEAALKAIGS